MDHIHSCTEFVTHPQADCRTHSFVEFVTFIHAWIILTLCMHKCQDFWLTERERELWYLYSCKWCKLVTNSKHDWVRNSDIHSCIQIQTHSYLQFVTSLHMLPQHPHHTSLSLSLRAFIPLSTVSLYAHTHHSKWSTNSTPQTLRTCIPVFQLPLSMHTHTTTHSWAFPKGSEQVNYFLFLYTYLSPVEHFRMGYFRSICEWFRLDNSFLSIYMYD